MARRRKVDGQDCGLWAVATSAPPGATAGIEELSLQKKIKVYGIDISTGDISVMTKPDSPWVITATADAANVGSVVLRAAALKARGNLRGNFSSLLFSLLRKLCVQTDPQYGSAQRVIPDLRTPN